MEGDKQTKILLAEDEEILGSLLKKKLENEGFNVIWKTDGDEALNAALVERPNLLLLDIVMPGMDGLSVLKRIRSDEKWGKDVPVMILSNLSEPNSVQEAMSVGVYDFLVKADWDIDDIVAKIRENLTK